MKICSICKVEKPIEEFRFDLRNGKRLREYCCKDCSRANHRKYAQGYRKRHPEVKLKSVKARRAFILRTVYGINENDYERMFEIQRGRCKVCHSTSRSRYGKVERLHIDHDHKTGKVRGLLCHMCNGALGLLRDDATILKRIIQYLEIA